METTITSETIKMDMNRSLEKLLEEVGIVQNSQTRIKDYEQQIQNYIAQNEEVLIKAHSLADFGFVSTPSFKNKAILENQITSVKQKINEIKDDIVQKRKLERTVAKYAIEFPTFKFIPYETMVEVMKKYDLILGDTCVYGKEIPSLALKLLSGFKDHIKSKKLFIDARFIGENLSYFAVKPAESFFKVEKPFNYIESNLKIIAPESHFENKMIKTNGIEVPTFIMNEDTRRYEVNLAKLNEIVKANIEVLDPILCLEVDEGFIVIHAWDEEAHIPEIRNTFLN